MGLSRDLLEYAENIWRRFPEVFLSLGSPDVEDYYELDGCGAWSHSITDTQTGKVIEIVLPRRGLAEGQDREDPWDGDADAQGVSSDEELDDLAAFPAEPSAALALEAALSLQVEATLRTFDALPHQPDRSLAHQAHQAHEAAGRHAPGHRPPPPRERPRAAPPAASQRAAAAAQDAAGLAQRQAWLAQQEAQQTREAHEAWAALQQQLPRQEMQRAAPPEARAPQRAPPAHAARAAQEQAQQAQQAQLAQQAQQALDAQQARLALQQAQQARRAQDARSAQQRAQLAQLAQQEQQQDPEQAQLLAQRPQGQALQRDAPARPPQQAEVSLHARRKRQQEAEQARELQERMLREEARRLAEEEAMRERRLRESEQAELRMQEGRRAKEQREQWLQEQRTQRQQEQQERRRPEKWSHERSPAGQRSPQSSSSPSAGVAGSRANSPGSRSSLADRRRFGLGVVDTSCENRRDRSQVSRRPSQDRSPGLVAREALAAEWHPGASLSAPQLRPLR